MLEFLNLDHLILQVEGVQDMAAMAGSGSAVELREELEDPLATPDVDKYVASSIFI